MVAGKPISCVKVNENFPRWLVLLPAAGVVALLFEPALAAVLLAASLGSLVFFRDPEREPEGEGLVSPADGVVKSIRMRDGLTRVSIFMRLRDVHVNRVPYSGEVSGIRYVEGSFRPAFTDVARNERNEVELATECGPLRVEQVAGYFARRIRCFLREGDEVERGERLGLIAFSSRVDLEVPLAGKGLRVSEGDTVKAGETVLVSLKGEDGV